MRTHSSFLARSVRALMCCRMRGRGLNGQNRLVPAGAFRGGGSRRRRGRDVDIPRVEAATVEKGHRPLPRIASDVVYIKRQRPDNRGDSSGFGVGFNASNASTCERTVARRSVARPWSASRASCSRRPRGPDGSRRPPRTTPQPSACGGVADRFAPRRRRGGRSTGRTSRVEPSEDFAARKLRAARAPHAAGGSEHLQPAPRTALRPPPDREPRARPLAGNRPRAAASRRAARCCATRAPRRRGISPRNSATSCMLPSAPVLSLEAARVAL